MINNIGYEKILIVGLGVVGGSFAKAIKKKIPSQYISAIDTNNETLEIAKKEKVIDEGSNVGIDLISEADLVIVCLYPEECLTFLNKYNSYFKKGATITDVVGVKRAIFNQMEKVIPDGINLILGHPMAGREQSGFDYSCEEVFKGANYLLTPTKQTNKIALEKFEDLIKSIGFSRITKTTIKRHDEMIAYTSQLSHVLAVSLINSEQLTDDTVSFIGDSYRDLTRIANMNAGLWAELFLKNSDSLLESINEFEKQLYLIKNYLQSNDKKQLQQLFEKATKRRQNLSSNDLKNK